MGLAYHAGFLAGTFYMSHSPDLTGSKKQRHLMDASNAITMGPSDSPQPMQA